MTPTLTDISTGDNSSPHHQSTFIIFPTVSEPLVFLSSYWSVSSFGGEAKLWRKIEMTHGLQESSSLLRGKAIGLSFSLFPSRISNKKKWIKASQDGDVPKEIDSEEALGDEDRELTDGASATDNLSKIKKPKKRSAPLAPYILRD
ncbi:hypothetical protein Btru_073054 [Bulinus truncatus]|nr:hypothetical protein Btru_073054 [Bulinus truncatus]